MTQPSFPHRLRTVLELIKFEHTLFALPFAFLGMILAAEGWPSWRVVGWIVVAVVSARSAAMAFNRLADRDYDAANPRTAARADAMATVGAGFMAGFVLVNALVFLLAASRFNRLSLLLGPIGLAIILGYSYTKRFTWLCHLVLGLALSLAPVGAWVAVRGELTTTSLLLGWAVLFWVSGFDILYALQDRDFDRRLGLHSLPARFGVVLSLWISALLHLGMLALLAVMAFTYPPGLRLSYGIGWLGAAALLVYQHRIVRPSDLSRLNVAFFQANAGLSLWLFTLTAVDILLRR